MSWFAEHPTERRRVTLEEWQADTAIALLADREAAERADQLVSR